MAWVTPRAWVTAEIVTKAKINEVSDSLTFLSTHGHSGDPGDGAAALTSLDSIDWDHQATLGAGAAGHAKMWMASDGTVHTHNAGGSELTLSATTHSHNIVDDPVVATDEDQQHPDEPVGNSVYEEINTHTFTPQGARHATVHVASYHGQRGSNTEDAKLRLLKAAAVQVTVTKSIASGAHDALLAQILYDEPTASSTAFTAEASSFESGVGLTVETCTQVVKEIQCH